MYLWPVVLYVSIGMIVSAAYITSKGIDNCSPLDVAGIIVLYPIVLLFKVAYIIFIAGD